MIKAIIVDDESLARKLVRNYLNDYREIEIVAECNNGFEALKAIQSLNPNLIFLDVQMPKLDGFELLELLDPHPAVIFTTAFDEYAIKAFENSAIDYLLKPFDKSRFGKAMDKFFHQFRQGIQTDTSKLAENISSTHEFIERIAVKSGTDIRIVPVSQIKYLEAYDDYVKIFTDSDMFLKKQTLSYYDRVLPQEMFIRVHRSLIINLKELTRIEQAEKDSHWVILKDNTRLTMSKTGYKKLKENLNM